MAEHILREDPQRVLILGAGRGGSALLEMFLSEDLARPVGIVDTNPEAEGMVIARKNDIATFTNIEGAVHACAPCVAFNLTGNEMVEDVASDILGAGGVIGGLEALLIWRMVTRLKRVQDELKFQVDHDELTGAYNRRALMGEIHAGIRQAQRYNTPYSIVMLDLDHFKQVNDTYGHVAGDTALKHTVNILKSHIRDVDMLGRWGGEEFMVLLPHTTNIGAQEAANIWLKKLMAVEVFVDKKSIGHISFSAGVASLTHLDGTSSELVDDLIKLADKRMYQAKANGRSQVVGE
ncbi:MAG: diguanylate cyclase [Mariprofundaceae bacterium]